LLEALLSLIVLPADGHVPIGARPDLKRETRLGSTDFRLITP
jgi:hypothetical protein